VAGAATDSCADRFSRVLLRGNHQELRELGYVEGKHLTIEYRYADGDFARLPELAAELDRLETGVLVVEGAIAARAAKDTTRLPGRPTAS
jgi:putative ABC transport system substrate-binding protein